MTQDEYVILTKDSIGQMELNMNKISESCQDYDLVDLQSISEEAIIIHKKYVQIIRIKRKLDKKLDFVPSKKLELIDLNSDCSKLTDYLNDDSIPNVPVEVSLWSLSKNVYKKMKPVFNTIFKKLNVKQMTIGNINDKFV